MVPGPAKEILSQFWGTGTPSNFFFFGGVIGVGGGLSLNPLFQAPGLWTRSNPLRPHIVHPVRGGDYRPEGEGEGDQIRRPSGEEGSGV